MVANANRIKKTAKNLQLRLFIPIISGIDVYLFNIIVKKHCKTI